MRLFPTILFFQLHTAHQAENDRAPGKIKRLKAINYCVDKQVATEDINCFPSEQSHMAEARNKWNRTGH